MWLIFNAWIFRKSNFHCADSAQQFDPVNNGSTGIVNMTFTWCRTQECDRNTSTRLNWWLVVPIQNKDPPQLKYGKKTSQNFLMLFNYSILFPCFDYRPAAPVTVCNFATQPAVGTRLQETRHRLGYRNKTLGRLKILQRAVTDRQRQRIGFLGWWRCHKETWMWIDGRDVPDKLGLGWFKHAIL